MSSLDQLAAFSRTPETAVLAAQAVQASDLAARQGQANIQRDAIRRQAQVQAPVEAQRSAAIGPQENGNEGRTGLRRRHAALALGSAPPEAPLPAHRLDIIA